jgi:energy-coupling factor transporter ATP-binding protein EcfA2
MIKSAQILAGFPMTMDVYKTSRVFKFNDKFNVIYGENGVGKSILLKTIAAHCGIASAGWSAISEPMKLGYNQANHFPYVYRQYTPGGNIDAKVEWDGTPTFYNDSDMLSKNDTTWFFSNASQSGDGITTESEQMDILAAKPSAGQYRIHKVNKIMQVIKTPPNLLVVPPTINNKALAQLEVNYIASLPRNGKMTLLLDEPEKALALPKQLELFETIEKLSEWFQVILVTHSPFILSFKGANLIDMVDGYSKNCVNLIRKRFKLKDK